MFLPGAQERRTSETKAKRVYAVFAAILLILMVFVVPAFAADDPLQVVNNLSDFSAPVRSR